MSGRCGLTRTRNLIFPSVGYSFCRLLSTDRDDFTFGLFTEEPITTHGSVYPSILADYPSFELRLRIEKGFHQFHHHKRENLPLMIPSTAAIHPYGDWSPINLPPDAGFHGATMHRATIILAIQ